jgi:hypothetical protein
MNYYIISLGPYCITKNAINKMNYNSKTMPFDWMFSSLTFIKNVIINDFEILLNRENIKSTNPCWDKNASYNILYNNDILQSKNITNHLLIKNELYDYNNFHMWRHYNLLEEEQFTKYKKYINRFKETIKSTDLKIFLFIQYYDNNCIEEIVNFNDYLMQNIINYKFICIKCFKVQNKTFDFNCSYNKENLYIYDLEIYTYEDNIEENDLTKIKKVIDSFVC